MLTFLIYKSNIIIIEGPVCLGILKVFLKKFKFFLFFYLIQINIF
jgi:hypothetical protein